MPDAAPYRLLAIDDDPASLEMLRAIASAEGFQFRGFFSGRDGLSSLAGFDPDVVCLDLQLADSSGVELCRQLKGTEDHRLLPVLIVTAQLEKPYKLEALEAGCDDFLTKPFDRLEVTTRIRVLARVSRANRDLEQANRVIESLALSIEARDPTTGGHSERVGKLAADIGAEIGFKPETVRALRQGGILHDIGKIGIPDSVLLKPSALSQDEWKVMREHPVMGESIVRPLRSMASVLSIIRHHHERWDGLGYPDGLRGVEIPAETRVFQIVDVFDALTQARPYRQSLNFEATMNLIEEEAKGGKWDPELVEFFARRMNGARTSI